MKNPVLVLIAIIFCSPALAGGIQQGTDISTKTVTPTGSVTSNSLANWLGAFPAENIVSPVDRVVTGTTDTILATDAAKTVVYKNAAGVAVTLPSASSAGFTQGFGFTGQNKGIGDVTYAPTTGLIADIKSLKIRQNDDCLIRSDSVNYNVSSCPVFGYNPSFDTGVMSVLDSRITITNASASGCSYVGADGNIHYTSAGSCAGRVDYNPSTLERKGIAFNTAATNLVPKSQITYSTAPYEWVTNGGAARAATTLRGQTGTRVTFAAISSSGYYSANNHTMVTGRTYTTSVLVKYISGDGTVQFGWDTARFGSGGTSKARIIFNSQTGSLVSADAGVASYTIEPWGDNTYRISVTAQYNYATDGTVAICFFHGTTAAVGVVDTYNIQVVEGSLAGPFIPTSGTAVTQSADVVSITNPYWFSNKTGTLCSAFSLQKNVSGGSIFSNADGTLSPLNFFSSTNAGSKDGTNTVDYALAFPSSGTSIKACIKYGEASSNVAINGVNGTQGAFDGSFGLTDIVLFNGLSGYLDEVSFSTYKFTDAEMMERTTP